jgi:hypothetical protein
LDLFMHKQVKNIWIKVKQYACQLYDRKYKTIKGYHPPRIIYIYSWSQHYFLCKGIHVIRILCRAHEIKGQKKGWERAKIQKYPVERVSHKDTELIFFIFHFFLLHNRVFFVLKFSIVTKRLRKWHSLQNI